MVKITTGNYDILSSGLFHALEDDESVLEIGNLQFVIIFKTEDEAPPSLSFEPVDGNSLKLIFTNFHDSLGRGNSVPIKVGHLNNRNLFISYRIFALEDKKLRTFEYTFYLEHA